MVIIMFTFVILTAFLLSQLPSNMHAGGGSNVLTNPSQWIAGTLYTPIDPVAGRTYTWTNASTIFSAGQSYFHPVDNANPISTKTVRNNTYPWFAPSEWSAYDNYYALERYNGFFVWERAPINLQTVCDEANRSGVNYANFTIKLGVNDYRIEFHALGNFSQSVMANNTFTVKMWVPTSSALFDPAGADWWQTIGNFFNTLSSLLFGYAVPGNPVLSYILSISIWSATVFIVLTEMQRSIHGGG